MTVPTTQADRAEISRRNGSKSRGPQSDEGKARSRMNALKHGMTGRIPVLPGEDEAAFRRRVNDITDALALRNAAEVLLAEQAVLASWKIERAERAEAARVAAALRAAEAGADLEKGDEIAAMGHWLLTDTLTARQDAAASLLPFLSEDRHDPFRPAGAIRAHRPPPRSLRRRLPVAPGPVGPAPRATRAGPRLADQRTDLGSPTARAAAVGPGSRRVGVPAQADPGQ